LPSIKYFYQVFVTKLNQKVITLTIFAFILNAISARRFDNGKTSSCHDQKQRSFVSSVHNAGLRLIDWVTSV